MTATLERRKRAGDSGGSKPTSRDVSRQRKQLSKSEARKLGEPGAFALHLDALLTERGLAPLALAEKCQASGLPIEEWQVRAWLRGENMPKTHHLRKLGKALGLADYRQVLPG